ncbi:MAG TPA: HEAT repeat domain-containing protein [Gemmatales bacterium]|nr:HEAT repeat domain-containing protein [Gemmatales bacterium]
MILALALVARVGGDPPKAAPPLSPTAPEPFFLNQTQGSWLRQLQQGDERQRQAAAFALGYFNQVPAEVAAALVAHLADADAHVRESAAQSLAELGPAAGPVAEAVRRRLEAEPEPGVARALALALGRLAPWSGAAAPELRKLASAADPTLRQAALAGLRGLGPAAGVEMTALLRRLAGDPDPGVRLEVARTVGLVPMPLDEAAALLQRLRADADPLVVMEAVASSPRLGAAAQVLWADWRAEAERLPDDHPRAPLLRQALARLEPTTRPARPHTTPMPTRPVAELVEAWTQRGPELGQRLRRDGVLRAEDEELVRDLLAAGNDPRLAPIQAELRQLKLTASPTK